MRNSQKATIKVEYSQPKGSSKLVQRRYSLEDVVVQPQEYHIDRPCTVSAATDTVVSAIIKVCQNNRRKKYYQNIREKRIDTTIIKLQNLYFISYGNIQNAVRRQK